MARVFVGNLPDDVNERDLEAKFERYGRIVNLTVKFPPRPPPFAFIEYEQEQDASDAVRAMNGSDFNGSQLRVEISHGGTRGGEGGGRQRGTQYRVTISHLPTSMSWQDLKDFLREGGDVVHTDVDRRGNGTASFATYDEMDRAIRKLDDREVDGERVRIREERGSDRTSRSRSRSPPRSRSRRHRSRSRSPSPRRSHRRRHSRSHSRSR